MQQIRYSVSAVQTSANIKRAWELIFIIKNHATFFVVLAILLATFFSSAKENSYKIGATDVLDIKVFGETEFTGTFRVGSDGTIDYPFLRKIKAEDKTIEELATEITRLLKDGYLSNPQVSVDVKDFKSQTVMVLGAVAKPGTYVLQEETRILDMISKAGGISTAGGKRVLLIRSKSGAEKKATPVESDKAIPEDTKPIVIDYFRLVHEGDFTQNLVLVNGDVLNVPKANEIFVLGNVARPGPISYEENMTILQAVTLAGGPTPIASTKSTYILRQGEKGEEKIEVRLDKILENKAKNVILKADDVIVVPESFF